MTIDWATDLVELVAQRAAEGRSMSPQEIRVMADEIRPRRPATDRKGMARVRLRLDAVGMGEVVINGIHMGHLVSRTSLYSSPGDLTVLTLSIPVGSLEFETDEVKTLIDWLTPEEPPVREHRWKERKPGHPEKDVCQDCRQARRVAAAVCPGPIAYAR